MWVPGIKLKSSVRLSRQELTCWASSPTQVVLGFLFICLFVSLGKTQLLRMPCPCLELSLHFVFLTSFYPSDASSNVPFWGILSALLPGWWISARAITVWNYTPICRTHSHLLPHKSMSAEGPASFLVINNTDAHCFFFIRQFLFGFWFICFTLSPSHTKVNIIFKLKSAIHLPQRVLYL